MGLVLNVDFLRFDVLKLLLSGYVLSILLCLTLEHVHLVPELSYLHSSLEVRVGVFEVWCSS